MVSGACTLVCAGSTACSLVCVLCGASEVPCVPPALLVNMAQGSKFFPSFKFLLGVKGGAANVPLLWWVAWGSSFVPSSFSVVGNDMSPGLYKSTVLGVRVPPPRVSAVL